MLRVKHYWTGSIIKVKVILWLGSSIICLPLSLKKRISILDREFLLTGDKKDFGSLFGRTVQGVKVVTVKMLMEELETRGLVKFEEEDG